jgi:hypothetical protein
MRETEERMKQQAKEMDDYWKKTAPWLFHDEKKDEQQKRKE